MTSWQTRFARRLETIFVTLQAIVAVCGVVIAEILNARSLQLTLISALLSMIVLDFYLLFTNRLTLVSRRIDEIAAGLSQHGYGVEFVERGQFNWKEAVASAKNDIFISGTTLTTFVPYKDSFRLVDGDVSIRFLVLDVAEKDILEGFRRMRYADSRRHSGQRYMNQASVFKDMYRALESFSNIAFAVSDRIMPMAFVAVDTERLSEASMIRVQHYLHENEADEATVSYVVRPGNPVFAIYASQIRVLWEHAAKSGSYLDNP